MEKKGLTKERIVEEALTLFSTKGYKGTSVKNIADAVGIKDSSIYKHYKSKREIVDAIVEQMKLRMNQLSVRIGLPQDDTIEKTAAAYAGMTSQDLQQLTRKVFLFYLQDDFMSKFWRFATMEQYQDQDIYEIYRSIFFEQSMAYQKALFAEMIRQGIFVKEDAGIMAMHYYAPLFFLLSKYAGREKLTEEALELLDRHVETFYRIYRTKN